MVLFADSCFCVWTEGGKKREQRVKGNFETAVKAARDFDIWKTKSVRSLTRRRGIFGDSVELGDRGRRQFQRYRAKIFSKMV